MKAPGFPVRSPPGVSGHFRKVSLSITQLHTSVTRTPDEKDFEEEVQSSQASLSLPAW